LMLCRHFALAGVYGFQDHNEQIPFPSCAGGMQT